MLLLCFDFSVGGNMFFRYFYWVISFYWRGIVNYDWE